MPDVQATFVTPCTTDQDAVDVVAYFSAVPTTETQRLVQVTRDQMTVTAIIEYLGWNPPGV